MVPAGQDAAASVITARGAARDILPIATEAIMVMSANARAIWNCIVLRGNEHAEAVIRDIYVQVAKIKEELVNP